MPIPFAYAVAGKRRPATAQSAGNRWEKALIFHYPRAPLHLDYLVNPIPGLAMAGMALNDHYLKRAFPGWLSGKLSDYLGMFYFPLFLCALACLAANGASALGKQGDRPVAYIGPWGMRASCAFALALLTAVKLSSGGNAWVVAEFSRHLFPIRIALDPTDMQAAAALPLSYLYAGRFFGRGP